uniref:Uncharacterized protein n=1 Tax=Glossina pallidipes TaxID=7398 RepID=A0A1A9ZYI8_GLOPL
MSASLRCDDLNVGEECESDVEVDEVRTLPRNLVLTQNQKKLVDLGMLMASTISRISSEHTPDEIFKIASKTVAMVIAKSGPPTTPNIVSEACKTPPNEPAPKAKATQTIP